MLNQNDYRLEVKEKFKGIPKLFTSNKKDENPKKVYNNNKLYVNNYISGEKTKKEEKENMEDKGEEKDKETGKSRGFGFLKFYEKESAFKAMKDADNIIVGERNLLIRYSNDKGSQMKGVN